MTPQRPANCPPVTVIICTLNEAQNLPHVLPKIPDWVDEILLVDGNSTDDTIKVAKQLRPDIKIITQPGRGKGDALKFGIAQAMGDVIVTLDADGQTNADEIDNFIITLIDGCEFVKGTRLRNGKPLDMPFHRWIGNSIIALTCNILYKTKFTDLCSGYNAFLKEPLLRINPWDESWGFEPLIIARILKRKIKVNEVQHLYIKRIHGKSKLPDIKQGFTAVYVLIRERFRH